MTRMHVLMYSIRFSRRSSARRLALERLIDVMSDPSEATLHRRCHSTTRRDCLLAILSGSVHHAVSFSRVGFPHHSVTVTTWSRYGWFLVCFALVVLAALLLGDLVTVNRGCN